VISRDTHTPKEQDPYVIAGHTVCDDANIVLTSIDTCAPKVGTADKNAFNRRRRILGNRDISETG
jgi:hypothetical protein